MHYGVHETKETLVSPLVAHWSGAFIRRAVE